MRATAVPLYVYRKVDEYPLCDVSPPIRITVDYAKASLRGRRYTSPRLVARRRR